MASNVLSNNWFYPYTSGLLHQHYVIHTQVSVKQAWRIWVNVLHEFTGNDKIDGLVQNCSNSSALVMELLQSCTEPSIWTQLNKTQQKLCMWDIPPICAYQYLIVETELTPAHKCSGVICLRHFPSICISYHVEAGTRWPPLFSWHHVVNFLVWKLLDFD